MKKFLSVIAFALTLGFTGFAQVLDKPIVQNTLWTGFGNPTGEPGSAYRPDFRWYGFIDTLQVRADIDDFIIDGMLAWGALTTTDINNHVDGFTFANTRLKPISFMLEDIPSPAIDPFDGNRNHNDKYNYGDDSYYLNFIWNPLDNLSFGIGTRLEWDVGPSPSRGAYTWEARSHVNEGDLRDGVPGEVPVAGFLYYPNTYAQKALAVRYKYKNLFELGGAIQDGSSTSALATNVGFEITPVDFLTIAFAYERLFLDDSHMYTGATVRLSKDFIIDGYVAFNNIGKNYKRTGKWGTGGGVLINFSKINLSVRPEAGFTWYSDSDYTMAFYTGGKVNYDFMKNYHLGCWVSFAWGASDENWGSDRTGGFIFNIRPEFSFDLSQNHNFAVTTEFESLTDNHKNSWDSILVGLYWRFKSR